MKSIFYGVEKKSRNIDSLDRNYDDSFVTKTGKNGPRGMVQTNLSSFLLHPHMKNEHEINNTFVSKPQRGVNSLYPHLNRVMRILCTWSFRLTSYFIHSDM